MGAIWRPIVSRVKKMIGWLDDEVGGKREGQKASIVILAINRRVAQHVGTWQMTLLTV